MNWLTVGVSGVPSTASAVRLGGCQAADRMLGSAVSVREIDPLKIKSVGVNNMRFSGAVTAKGATQRELSGHSPREISMLV